MPADARTRCVLEHLFLNDVFATQSRETRRASAKIFEELRERRRRRERLVREIIPITKRRHAPIAQILTKFEALQRQRLDRLPQIGFFGLSYEVRLIKQPGQTSEVCSGRYRQETFCLHRIAIRVAPPRHATLRRSCDESARSARGERALEVADDIADRLDAHREANRLLGDTAQQTLLGRELLMGRRGGMDHK
jgi:hypothetical protein